jgi:hypothetical protein
VVRSSCDERVTLPERDPFVRATTSPYTRAFRCRNLHFSCRPSLRCGRFTERGNSVMDAQLSRRGPRKWELGQDRV